MVDEIFDWHAASCSFISSVIISPSCTILELRHVDGVTCTGGASMSSNMTCISKTAVHECLLFVSLAQGNLTVRTLVKNK